MSGSICGDDQLACEGLTGHKFVLYRIDFFYAADNAVGLFVSRGSEFGSHSHPHATQQTTGFVRLLSAHDRMHTMRDPIVSFGLRCGVWLAMVSDNNHLAITSIRSTVRASGQGDDCAITFDPRTTEPAI